ncbi:Uncharacterised protein [Legionella cincinnatiensis]|uniref:Uncharacterized protein n=1 Tax=Legionella cincinnatiensis TaxID=28085 RepID=A0A378IG27_9GAMM|nr:Uncharacterised protein [Legionella cincinnatiensis]
MNQGMDWNRHSAPKYFYQILAKKTTVRSVGSETALKV